MIYDYDYDDGRSVVTSYLSSKELKYVGWKLMVINVNLTFLI
jgi:hypothetical protein